MIEETDKLWQKSVFDLKTSEEISYEDNKGISYSIGDDGYLIYYKNNNFYVDQKMFSELPRIPSSNPSENLFLDICQNLKIKKNNNQILFVKGGQTYMWFIGTNLFLSSYHFVDHFSAFHGKTIIEEFLQKYFKISWLPNYIISFEYTGSSIF